MDRTRKYAFRWLACSVLAVSGVWDSQAQTYPTKATRLLVGFAAGGGTDIAARLIASKWTELFGQQMIVENIPGAGGSVSLDRASKSRADGYTLVMMAAAGTIQSTLRNDLPYDLERDLVPVSLVMSGPLVLVVNTSMAANNVKELLAIARSQPGKLTFGSAGIGSSNHMAGELLNMLAGIKTVHVPYRGSGESVIGTAGGEVNFNFPSVTAALPLINARKLRAIGVSTKKRSSLVPGMPTLDESGVPGYDRYAWYGVLVPAGVNRNIVLQLNTAIHKLLSGDEMKEAFKKEGAEPSGGTSEEFAALIRSEIEINKKLVQISGIKAE